MPKKKRLIIGVDLGGTKIEAAIVRDGHILASKKTKTQADQGVDSVIDRIEKTVRAAMKKADRTMAEVLALCIGAPGAVDHHTGIVHDAPNLGWQDVLLGEILQQRLGLPVLVDNDVNIGLVGEHVYGAGRGTLHMAGIFVGTGIGGGFIMDGKPYYGARGAAGEIGHIIVSPHGRRCRCGREGCVEAYASKTAMEAMVREQIDAGRHSIVLDLMRQKDKDGLTSSVVADALAAQDAVMAEVVQTAQYYLGLLTANLVNAFDPEVVVFGGGLATRLGESFLEPIARTARQHYLQQQGAERIRIVPAFLGDHAGTIGAATVAKRRLQGTTTALRKA
jgi:glucokinase